MSELTYEVVRVRGDNLTPDLLIWRRYRRPAPGVLELLLEANPDLAEGLLADQYLPVGAMVAIPIDPSLVGASNTRRTSVKLYGDA